MYHRKWYDTREAAVRHPTLREWTRSRVRGDVVGDVSAEEWSNLDAFGRCCWYWSYTNRLIREDIARLNLEALPLKIEQLAESVPTLARFLGLRDVPGDVGVVDPASAGRPQSWRRWSPRQRRVFQRFCGDVMTQHYPGWETEMDFGVGDELIGLVARGGKAAREQLGTRSRPWRDKVRAARKSRARARAAESSAER
jgi:hypothetical protein